MLLYILTLAILRTFMFLSGILVYVILICKFFKSYYVNILLYRSFRNYRPNSHNVSWYCGEVLFLQR